MLTTPNTLESASQLNRKRGLLLAAAGLSLLLAGAWGLWWDVEWIAQPFYAYAWWGYILFLDGFIALRRGHSLLTARTQHVLPMLIWSASFWYFFEMLNLRFKNWYYVGVFKNVLVGYPFSLVCFATVLIGMFETYEAVTSLGLWRNWRGKPSRFPWWVSYAVQLVGAAMVTLSLVFPTYLAPLVWGSVSFLLDPRNYRRGARSILRDFEERDFGLVARLLFGGLICGGVWESMNFFAPQKWIYTVRGLENFKLFEMPLLGFAGFPALALDGMAVYSLLSYWFLGNETWEHAEDLRYQLTPRPALPRSVFLASIPFQIVFGAVVLAGVRHINMASEQLAIQDLPSLSQPAAAALTQEGIHRPIRLVREARSASRREEIQARLGLADSEFETVLDEASLYAFKGIGAWHGKLLEMAGIRRVQDLASKEPEDLQRTLAKFAEDLKIRPPRLDMVRVWILAARDRGILLRTTRTANTAS
jgi:hypothetical protein